MRILFTLVMSGCLVWSCLQGAVFDYLKPAEGKTEGCQIDGIDFIYMINLDERPEKWAGSLAELEPFGITPYRFSAVNGWELPLDVLNKVGVVFRPEMPTNLMGTCYLEEDGGLPRHECLHVPGRTYFSHCMSRGAIGIVLSHLSILKDAYDSGYQTIWVMEDDIEVIRDPHFISRAIDALDQAVGRNNWDILFTDRDTKDNQGRTVPCTSYAKRPNFSPRSRLRFARRYPINNEMRSIGARYGAYSMVIRRSGMKKILDFFDRYQIFLPYDMEFYLPETIKLVTVRDDIVSTKPGSLSDNGGPNYKRKTKE